MPTVWRLQFLKIMRLNLLFIKSMHRCAFHTPLQWCHNDHDGASNHQPHDCLLNRLFRRRSKKTLKLSVTGLCVGNSSVTDEFLAQFVWGIHRWPMNSSHKGPVTRKMFPFDDIIITPWGSIMTNHGFALPVLQYISVECVYTHCGL